MFFLNRKAKLNGHKRVKVNGFHYVIRRVNPLLDFPPDKIPSVFSSYQDRVITQKHDSKKSLEIIQAVLEKGVVKPSVGHTDKDAAITSSDLIRHLDTGYKLYSEIMAHSLNAVGGFKGFFLSLKLRHMFYMELQKTSVADLLKFISTEETIPAT